MNVVLRAADGATAEVSLFGAQVLSWRPAPGTDERLFLSATADLSGSSAIRGGIPVIFPQFAKEGPLPRHGFARTSMWTLDEERTENDDAIATFSLSSSDATRAIWPVEFLTTLTVRVGGDQLNVTLSVENRDAKDISFTCALHAYLRVHEAAECLIIGLHGARYRQSGTPEELAFDDDEHIALTGPIDRVYVDAPRHVMLREPNRDTAVTLEEFPDVVLWNPGAAAAAELSDMEAGGERRMVCIEAAAVQEHIVLAPERRWSGTETFTAVPLRRVAPP